MVKPWLSLAKASLSGSLGVSLRSTTGHGPVGSPAESLQRAQAQWRGDAMH